MQVWKCLKMPKVGNPFKKEIGMVVNVHRNKKNEYFVKTPSFIEESKCMKGIMINPKNVFLCM
jgi:hypothetical protein